ncbi:MAG: SAM-dependent methyltransferase [Crocinitomix sp.]|jgi:SAM-dependent methyltransferase
MAHKAQRKFCIRVKEQWPTHFLNTAVLDVGSLDINGNNRFLFENSSYLGIDIAAGTNVDQVVLAHELDLTDQSFDTVISTECFEHDMHYKASLENIIRMLKPGGLFLFTCATTGRKEHGTRRTSPSDSPFTCEIEEGWGDYYKNLTETDIRDAISIESYFSECQFEDNRDLFDLYFWGIKK